MKVYILILILFLFILVSPVYASIHKVSHFLVPGSARDLVVYYDNAFVIGNGTGLEMVDVSDPQSPQTAISWGLSDNLRSLWLEGSSLYAVGDSIGLMIFGLPSHNALTYVAAYYADYNSLSICVSSHKAYIVTDGFGMVIYNIENPQDPQYLGYYDNNLRYEINAVTIDSTAYIIDNSGIQFVNVSDPTSPSLINTYTATGVVKDIAVIGSTAYLLCSDHLEVLDVTNPANPQLLDSYILTHDVADVAQSLMISGNVAYVSSSKEISMLDVSNQSNISLLNTYQIPTSSNVSVYSVGNHIYMTHPDYDLQILDTSDLNDALLLGTLNADYPPSTFDIAGDLAYVGYNHLGFHIINVSNPQNPQILGTYGDGGNVRYVKVIGNIAYVLMTGDIGSGLYLIDISNAQNPQLLDRYRSPTPLSCSISDGKAYLFDASIGLEIINISNPTHAFYQGTFYSPGEVSASQIIGNKAYITIPGMGLYIVNISNPTNPYVIGFSESFPRAQSIVVQDTIAYACTESGVKVIDIANSVSPSIINTILPTPSSRIGSMDIKNHMLFLCDESWDTEYVYDIQDPMQPVLLHQIPGNLISNRMIFSDHILYTLNGNEGLNIFNYDFVVPTDDIVVTPVHVLSLTNFPNPFNPDTSIRFSIPDPCQVSLKIYNIRGELVKNLIDDYFVQGNHSVLWNGMDDHHAKVASGVYFARIEAGRKGITRKMVLVK